MNDRRRPGSFPVKPQPTPEFIPGRSSQLSPRRPQALKIDHTVTITPPELDAFDQLEPVEADPPPVLPGKRRSRLGTILVSSLGMIGSLALALWADRFVRDLFARADWLGWLGLVLVAAASLAALAIVLREIFALARLASVEKIRRRSEDAYERDDMPAAKAVVSEISALLSSHPETAAGRQRLSELKDDVIDGRDILNIAERELLAPIDARARKLVLDAAKRVSLVTALSPRAFLDIAYVMFESARLLRRLSALYCGRPGFLGFFRLARSVLAHLAITGSMAMGESLVQQLVGQGLAARLSARLGEGVVNGMMTARIGIAAIVAVRPLAFRAVQRPGMGDFLKALTQFAANAEKTRPEKQLD